ncbi:unnamed protein product [Closterium sp. NIES-54]
MALLSTYKSGGERGCSPKSVSKYVSQRSSSYVAPSSHGPDAALLAACRPFPARAPPYSPPCCVWGAELGGAEPGGAEPASAQPEGVEPEGAEPGV